MAYYGKSFAHIVIPIVFFVVLILLWNLNGRGLPTARPAPLVLAEPFPLVSSNIFKCLLVSTKYLLVPSMATNIQAAPRTDTRLRRRP